jgi:plastocyanin
MKNNMKKIILILLWILSFNVGQAQIRVISVWSGYYQFIPEGGSSGDTLQVQLGDTIQWLPYFGNLPTSGDPHTITSTTIPIGAASFDAPWALPADTFFQYIPQVVGLYNYECTPHATSMNMKGYFNVQSSTGIANNNQLQLKISIFPNPANSQINVKADSKLLGSVYTVYDNTGKVVLSGNIISESNIIELGNLSGGIYLLSLGENIKQTFKVIKE